MLFIKTNEREQNDLLGNVCANERVCRSASSGECKEAGYSGQASWYSTHIVQKSVGGLDFKG